MAELTDSDRAELRDRAERATASLMAEIADGGEPANVRSLVRSALTLGWTRGYLAGFEDGFSDGQL